MHAKSTLYTISRAFQLFSQLLWIWITLDWKMRKARKAFEKELIRAGLSKEDAQRLSRRINMLKDPMMHSLWQFARV